MNIQGWIRRMVGIDTEGDEPASVVAAAPGIGVRAAWRRLWPYARPYRTGIATGLVLIALIPAIQTAEIWLFKVVVDEVFTPRDLEPIAWIAAAYIGLNLLSGLVSFGDEYIATSIAERSLLALRRDLFRKTIDMPPHVLDRRPLGDLVTRFTSDVSAVETLLVSGASEGIAAVAKIVFFTGALFWLDPLVAAASLVVAPLFWMAARAFSERIRRAARARRSHSGSLASVAEESLSNAALIQSFNRQDQATERFVGQNRAMVRAELEATRIASLFGPLVDVLELAGGLAVIGLGTWALSEGRLTLGGLLAFLTYLSQLYRPVRDLTELSGELFAAAASAERVIELLDAEPGVAAQTDAPALRIERAEVAFHDVTFTYPGATGPAVREVSASASRGELVAFAGPSGAGKSTLAKLLLRFFDPDSGRVTIDGQDLAHVRLDSARSAIAFVPQESLVFDGTIWDNIAFAAPEASEAAVLGAATAAGLDEWVSTLSNGYATLVGQKGRSLSGGQRQRLAIARALLRDTAVLVLDEPTTGLDARSREGVMQTLAVLARTRTVVLISHDLASVRRADRIYVLVDGRVVEEGAHADLVSLGGAYARLWGARDEEPAGDLVPPAPVGR